MLLERTPCKHSGKLNLRPESQCVQKKRWGYRGGDVLHSIQRTEFAASHRMGTRCTEWGGAARSPILFATCLCKEEGGRCTEDEMRCTRGDLQYRRGVLKFRTWSERHQLE
jgi:hypothetical protein